MTSRILQIKFIYRLLKQKKKKEDYLYIGILLSSLYHITKETLSWLEGGVKLHGNLAMPLVIAVTLVVGSEKKKYIYTYFNQIFF